MLTHAGRRRPGLLTLAPDSASGQDLPPGRLASSVMRCWAGGADSGWNGLLEELGHVQTRDCDVPEDGHVVGTRLRGALLQCLDDGLLHVPAGVPAHGQQRADVLVPGRGDSRGHGAHRSHRHPRNRLGPPSQPENGSMAQVDGTSLSHSRGTDA